MNLDGWVDIVWHNSNDGRVATWFMFASQLVDGVLMNESAPDTNWRIRGIGDFDADGDADIIWQNRATGALAAWVMAGPTVAYGWFLPQTVPDTNWKIVAPR